MGLCHAPQLYAQIPTWAFHHLGSQNNLTDNLYNSFVYRDSRGFAWISSMSGINRFDGIEIKQYKSSDENPFFDMIQSSFYEDRLGDLWFAGYRGLNCYRRELDRIDTFRMNDSILGYQIFHIEREKELLWLKIGDSIHTYDLTSDTFSPLGIQASSVRFKVDTSHKGEVNLILGSLWVTGKGIELFQRNDEGNWTKENLLQNGMLQIALPPPIVPNAIIDNNRKVWLCTDQGLLHLDLVDTENAQLYHPKEVETKGFGYMCEVGDQCLLLSSKNQGLWLFDKEQTEFTASWKHEPPIEHSLISNEPNDLYVDHTHQLWVSHNGTGVDYTVNMSSFFSNPLAPLVSKALKIRTILQDQEGNKWLASINDGLYVLDSLHQSIRHFPYQSPVSSGLQLKDLRQIRMGWDGKVWCLGPRSLFRYNGEQNSWDKIIDSTKQTLFDMVHLTPERTIITTNQGVFDLKFQQGAYRLSRSPEFSDWTGFNFIQLFLTSQGYLITPTHNDTHNMYQVDEKGNLNFVKEWEARINIHGFFESPHDHVLWLATSEGPAYIDQEKLESRLLFPEGWDNDWGQVRAVIQDKLERLWISTNKGLLQYNPQTHQMLRFGETDGISSEEFIHTALLMDEKNQLWLGNAEGLTVFDTDSYLPVPNPPSPYIDELLVNNTRFLGERQIGEETKISLSFRDNSLAFRLLAVGMQHAEKYSVKYRLKNYNEAWRSIASGEYASFSKLPPGQFQLEIIAVGAQGQESKTQILEVTVRPPFWKTPLFFMLCLIAIAGMVFGFVKIYIDRKLRIQKVKFELEKAKQDERERIAGELHDELATELSVIHFLAEDIDPEDVDEYSRSQLAQISASSANLLEQTRDIVWALNTENDTFDNLIEYLGEYISRYLMMNRLNYELDFPEGEFEEIELSGKFRRNVYLIIKESLRNIVKHAEASHVKIKFELRKHSLKISIQDDGKGIDRANIRNGANGLKNLYKRARTLNGALDIQSELGKGTEIKLETPIDIRS
jgi:signal transduction histidine kinase/ligand-binding sensor domain-containing protein